MIIVCVIIAMIFLLLFSLPWLIFQAFRYKVSHTSSAAGKAYWSYTSAMFLLNQLGYTRGNFSALHFAMKDIDPYFDTDFSKFIQVYLKSKYSSKSLTAMEQDQINIFYFLFEKTISNKVPRKEYFGKFLNFYRTIMYFSQPKHKEWKQA